MYEARGSWHGRPGLAFARRCSEFIRKSPLSGVEGLNQSFLSITQSNPKEVPKNSGGANTPSTAVTSGKSLNSVLYDAPEDIETCKDAKQALELASKEPELVDVTIKNPPGTCGSTSIG